MRFKARILTAGNAVSEVMLDAVDEAAARKQLAESAAHVMSLQTASDFRISFSGRKVRFDLLLFSQELLALLQAGLSLVEGLEALHDKEEQPDTQQILQRLLQNLQEGRRLSSAMELQPALFPPLYVGLIQAAENTSDLPATLERYVQYQKRANDIRNKIISAAVYPVILLVVGGAVAAFLIGYVVPKFAAVYQSSGRELPMLSRVLLSWGTFAGEHGALVLIIITSLLAACVFGIRHMIVSGWLSRRLPQLPWIGNHYRLYLLSRLYMTLGMLLQGGTPIIKAMESTRTVVPLDWQERLAAASSRIESGEALSGAFETHGLTTPITSRMLSVGEKTGRLGDMLNQAARFHEEDVGRFVERFMKALEPILMTIIGVVVGVIVILLYMPIFDLAGSLQ